MSLSTDELCQLLVNSGNGLLEHPAVMRSLRASEVSDRPGARQLECGPPLGDRLLLGRQVRLPHPLAGSFILLRFD
jgi:hypothetical protein